jgi:hypothetical protein
MIDGWMTPRIRQEASRKEGTNVASRGRRGREDGRSIASFVEHFRSLVVQQAQQLQEAADQFFYGFRCRPLLKSSFKVKVAVPTSPVEKHKIFKVDLLKVLTVTSNYILLRNTPCSLRYAIIIGFFKLEVQEI